jgi:hypothetical protein
MMPAASVTYPIKKCKGYATKKKSRSGHSLPDIYMESALDSRTGRLRLRWVPGKNLRRG